MSTIRNMVNCASIPKSETPLWDINRIETFFKSKTLPKTLRVGIENITDLPKLIDRHLGYLRANPYSPVYWPYFDRLTKIAKMI